MKVYVVVMTKNYFDDGIETETYIEVFQNKEDAYQLETKIYTDNSFGWAYDSAEVYECEVN